jgi:hypothetical protein
MTWNVIEWPTIRNVEKGKSRSAVEEDEEDEENEEASEYMEEDLVVVRKTEYRPTLQDLPGPSTRSRTRKAASNVGTLVNAPSSVLDRSAGSFPAVPISTSASLTHGPAPSRLGASDTHFPSHQLNQAHIMYSDILEFDRQASDPTTSSLALQILRSEIRSIMVRERNQAAEIEAKVTDRRRIWKELIVKLDDDIGSLASEEVEENGGNEDYDGEQLLKDGATGNAQPETGESMGQLVIQ